MKSPVAGHIDEITMDRVAGWVWDRRKPRGILRASLLMDGEPLASAEANQFREDLQRAGIGSGQYGFAIRLPPNAMNRARLRRARLVLETNSRPPFRLPIVDFGTIDPQSDMARRLAERPPLRMPILAGAGARRLAEAIAAPANPAGAAASDDTRLAMEFDNIVEGMRDTPRRSLGEINADIRFGLDTPFLETSWQGLSVSRFMAAAYMRHKGLSTAPLADTADAIAAWYFLEFCAAPNADRFVTAAQARRLKNVCEFDDLALAARLIWMHDKRLMTLYDLRDAAARRRFMAWFTTSGLATYGLSYIRRADGWLEEPRSPDIETSASPAAITPRPLELEKLVSFGQRGNAARYMLRRTWHDQESDFCWAFGEQGLLAFNLRAEASRPLLLDATLVNHRPPRIAQDPIEISFNGATVHRGVPPRGVFRVVAPLSSMARTGASVNILGFHAKTFRPCDEEDVSDNRPLGIAVERLWLREHV